MNEKKWWKEAIVYQIYPKSFMDSNDDGVGDLRGIINKLDYLEKLGISVIWLSPIYQSPMDDGGYDISNYYQVDEMFGSNEDLEELIEKAKLKNIKIIMDLVINHTSDEHEWFQQALAQPNSKYRDYYIFRKGTKNQPPNNWRSYFGSSAWERVPNEESLYYLHAFGKKQPDLNWENEKVREDLYEMVNYWLGKGIAGFRIDAILNIKKRIELGTLPSDGEDGMAFIGNWILNQPGIEKWLAELRDKTFIPHDSMTVAEADVPENRLTEYIGKNGYFSMVFDFSYTDIDVPSTGEWYKPSDWTVKEFREKLFNNQLVTQRKGWAANYLENHDQPRSINKYIDSSYQNNIGKKMLATLFMCLRGTPFIYQGQEIGMSNIKMENMNDYDDIATRDQYQRALLSGLTEEEAFEMMYDRSRDNSRTPMQWSGEQQAGFSKAKKTWLKVNPNYQEVNVEEQSKDEASVLKYYQKLIKLRSKSFLSDVLTYGEFIPVDTKDPNLIVYKRQNDQQIALVVINFSKEVINFEVDVEQFNLVISNYDQLEILDNGQMIIPPYGSFVYSKEVKGERYEN